MYGLLFEEPLNLETSISDALVVVGLRPCWPQLPPDLCAGTVSSILDSSLKWGSAAQSQSKKEKSPDLGGLGAKIHSHFVFANLSMSVSLHLDPHSLQI